MATPPAPPSSAYVSQAGLAASFGAVIRTRWPNLSRIQLYALLQQFSRASAGLAAQDYSARRVEAGIRSRFTVPRADPASQEQFVSTLNWVYDNVEIDSQTAEQRLEAAMTRLAVQTGRETTVQAVSQDPRARAWAREARANCCYLCALLTSRGAVYRSESSAGREANDKFTGDGQFKFHNNCRCIAVPVFGTYEPTADARQWAADYRDLKTAHGGVSLNLWRQHFEGRLNQDDPQSAGS